MKTVLEEWSEKTNPMAYSDFLFDQNENLRKEVKRLQEQLAEANEVIKSFYWKDRGQASSYCKKWGLE